MQRTRSRLVHNSERTNLNECHVLTQAFTISYSIQSFQIMSFLLPTSFLRDYFHGKMELIRVERVLHTCRTLMLILLDPLHSVLCCGSTRELLDFLHKKITTGEWKTVVTCAFHVISYPTFILPDLWLFLQPLTEWLTRNTLNSFL